jgi:quinol monooxygenase YgiN
MMILLMKATPQKEKKNELIGILRKVAGPTLPKSGCLSCALFEGSDDTTDVLYIEQWDSMETIQRHIKSPTFAGLLAAMELSATRPEFGFYEVSEVHGFELVESLRRPPKTGFDDDVDH